MVVCAGYVLATRNLWIGIAKLIYCFNVEYSEVHFLPPFLPPASNFASANLLRLSISKNVSDNDL